MPRTPVVEPLTSLRPPPLVGDPDTASGGESDADAAAAMGTATVEWRIKNFANRVRLEQSAGLLRIRSESFEIGDTSWNGTREWGSDART